MTDLEFITIYNKYHTTISSLCKLFTEIKTFLITRFTNNTTKYIAESAYRILNNIQDIPTCPVCGNAVAFVNIKSGYKVFCSHECKFSEKGRQYTREKYKLNMLAKYGVTNPMQLQYVKDKAHQTCMKNYGVPIPAKNKNIREKLKQTMLKKYGVEYALQSAEFFNKAHLTLKNRYNVEHALLSALFQEKFKHTMLENYGVDFTGLSDTLRNKMIKTFIERYGVDNPMKNKDVYEKVKQSCLEKYGVEYISQSDICKQKMQENNFQKYGVKFTTLLNEVKQKVKATNIKIYGPNYISKFINKGKQTKKANGTYATSNVEKTLYEYLCVNFGEHNIKRLYSSEKYNFNCDFYITTYNIYIEIQGSWTHGKHPFDSTNEGDILTKQIWESKESDYYKSALDVWTYRDVIKRECAKNNNLNFIEIFSIDPIYCYECITSYINADLFGYMLYS